MTKKYITVRTIFCLSVCDLRESEKRTPRDKRNLRKYILYSYNMKDIQSALSFNIIRFLLVIQDIFIKLNICELHISHISAFCRMSTSAFHLRCAKDILTFSFIIYLIFITLTYYLYILNCSSRLTD